MAFICQMFVGIIALALVTTANAQTNPGFENGITGWSTFNNAFVLGTGTGNTGPLASGSPHGGLNVLQLYGPFFSSWDASGATQDIATTPGTAWTLSGYGMNPSGDKLQVGGLSFGILQIQWINGANAVIGAIDSTTQINQGTATDVWQSLSAAGVAPAGTVAIRLTALHVNSPANESGSVYFDDIKAIPEPSSIILVGMGLLGLLAVRRRS